MDTQGQCNLIRTNFFIVKMYKKYIYTMYNKKIYKLMTHTHTYIYTPWPILIDAPEYLRW